MTISIGSKLAGEYRLLIERDGVTTDTGWFDNIVLNQGLNYLGGDGGNPVGYCRLGTGTSVATENQTALDAQVGVSPNGSSVGSAYNSNNAAGGDYSSNITYSWIFAQGAVVGNIAEIGVGWSTTGNTLFSRALITDSFGNPTTIAIIAIDQLTVYYRLKITPWLGQSSGSVTINGIAYPYTAQIASCASFATDGYALNSNNFIAPWANTLYSAFTDMGAITGTPVARPGKSNGSQSWNGYNGGASVYNGGYTNGTYYRDQTWTWGITYGNFVGAYGSPAGTGGIGAMTMSWGGTRQCHSWQIVFSIPIPKLNTQVLSLSTRYTWSR